MISISKLTTHELTSCSFACPALSARLRAFPIYFQGRSRGVSTRYLGYGIVGDARQWAEDGNLLRVKRLTAVHDARCTAVFLFGSVHGF